MLFCVFLPLLLIAQHIHHTQHPVRHQISSPYPFDHDRKQQILPSAMIVDFAQLPRSVRFAIHIDGRYIPYPTVEVSS
jgi:hypothetical protein